MVIVKVTLSGHVTIQRLYCRISRRKVTDLHYGEDIIIYFLLKFCYAITTG
jgi:hypothetical protein